MIKTDCFGYDEKKCDCKILKKLYCENEECNFYKTKNRSKRRKRSMKYRSKRTVIDGITFDSKKEANRYCELKLLEKSGEIKNLELQKKYILIPAQRIDGKLIERECSYRADFVYETKDGIVVEDTKGFRTAEYKIKRKLMLERYGIRILES